MSLGTAHHHPRAAGWPCPSPYLAYMVVEPRVWAYPLGSQVLHGRVSLEEFEQALGSGWSLLCMGPLEATEG